MKPLCLAAGAALSLLLAQAHAEHFYQTKTPYAPQQDSASYEAPPPGYQPVYTQLLARHGSRGLSSSKADLALYNLWRLAEQDNALTPLGRALGPDLERMMKANALLGYGVPGISRPGYGNETRQGMAEHAALAQRLYARLPQLFQDAPQAGRRLLVVSSGKDRAVDSAYFFTESLLRQQPSLAPLVDRGTDRFELYFHKLNDDDRPDAAQQPVYAASQAYQRWAASARLREIEAGIRARPEVRAAAQATLARLFTPDFIAALDAGRRSAANTGSRRYTSADGKFSATVHGDGRSRIASVTDAGFALYELYAAAADMQAELAADFTRYLAPAQARVYAEAEDAIAFYEKGPGLRDNGDLNWRMAGALLADLFRETDAIAAGNLSHAAKLRFAHAEIVIPLAAALGLPGMADQLPENNAYSYQSNSWRGATVAPMAANLQWDVYRNGEGRLLVHLLYNERESGFSPKCTAARIATFSHYYDYEALKSCYNQISVKGVDAPTY